MSDCVLCPGDVMIIGPGRPYRYQSEGETAYYWVHYTGLEAFSYTRAAVPQTETSYHIGIHQELIECFHKLFREFIVNDEAAKQLSVCILKEILLYTGRYAESKEQKGIPLAAIEYIHSHYRSEVDIDALAQMEHMSCTSFRIAFKKHTGMAPNEYLISQRISAACRLLTQTDLSINDVAAQVGYGDQYYFSRLFKKKVGIPPAKYRLNERRRISEEPNAPVGITD